MKKSARSIEPIPSSNPGLDLSSLVDVSFLLLIYFIATSTLMPEESDLGMLLKGPGPVGRTEIPDFEIVLRADGAVTGNDEVLDADPAIRELPLLHERLRIYKQASDLIESLPEVSIAANDAAQGQRFVDVLNCLASLEIHHVTFKMEPLAH